MRSIRYVLIALLVVTAVAFGFTEISEIVSGKDEGPTVTCPEDVLSVSVYDDESTYLKDVKASDPQDGDITDKVLVGGVSKLIENDTAKVTYFVFDSDDNMSSCHRMIRYKDYSRPVIKVTKPLHFATGETADLITRLSAEDVIDGDISESVRISTLLHTGHSQIYTVTAQVTNSLGDTTSVNLPVVYDDSSADRPLVNLKEQLVYLDRGAEFDPADYVESVTVRGVAQDLSGLFIDNEADTSKDGTYWVWYSYSNGDYEGISVLTVVVR